MQYCKYHLTMQCCGIHTAKHKAITINGTFLQAMLSCSTYPNIWQMKLSPAVLGSLSHCIGGSMFMIQWWRRQSWKMLIIEYFFIILFKNCILLLCCLIHFTLQHSSVLFHNFLDCASVLLKDHYCYYYKVNLTWRMTETLTFNIKIQCNGRLAGRLSTKDHLCKTSVFAKLESWQSWQFLTENILIGVTNNVRLTMVEGGCSGLCWESACQTESEKTSVSVLSHGLWSVTHPRQFSHSHRCTDGPHCSNLEVFCLPTLGNTERFYFSFSPKQR